jgi:MoaA/NifB/PqqE/SkfB family radical SAM enzyme
VVTTNPFTDVKLLRFPEVIAEWMRTGKTSGPIALDMDLTNKCPHNCPACPGEWRNDPNAELSTAEAIDYIHQFAEMGMRAVSFGGGGDPLAHPECLSIIETTKRLGLHVGVITNAAALSDKGATRLKVCADWIRVSLDAGTPETFASIHGVSASQFAYILGRIKLLAEVEGTATIGVGFLTNTLTQGEMIEAARLVKECGADYIQYRPFNYDLTDVSGTIHEAEKLYADDEFRVLASWPKYREMHEGYSKPYNKCHFPHFGTVLTAKGEMHVCCDMRCPAGSIGSLRENTARELWENASRLDVLGSLDVSKCPPLCRGNVHNLILDRIAGPVTHEVFL